jgi:hypothetical protein
MYFPLMVLHEGNIKMGGIGLVIPSFRRRRRASWPRWRPGIVGGDMPWALIVVGIMLGDRDDPHQSEEPDAGIGRHVPAARDHVGDFRRRLHPLIMDRMADKRASTRRSVRALKMSAMAGGVGHDCR